MKGRRLVRGAGRPAPSVRKGNKGSSGRPTRRTGRSTLFTTIVAFVTAIAGAFVGGGFTYWETRSTFAHEDATRAREELRSACAENLKVQGGIVYTLESARSDVVILNDFDKFSKDLESLNKIGGEGQAATMFLSAPESVQSEVSKFVRLTDQAVPLVARLGGIPKAFRANSEEDAAAEKAIEDVRTSLGRVAAACRTQLLPGGGG
jgi:hypothetical protein